MRTSVSHIMLVLLQFYQVSENGTPKIGSMLLCSSLGRSLDGYSNLIILLKLYITLSTYGIMIPEIPF
jgi:hypothetical protein